jgi:beta-glucosidase
VVQVYAGPLPAVDSPERKLVGFAKVELGARERINVRVEIEREQLSFWEEARERWVTPSASLTLSTTVGSVAGR